MNKNKFESVSAFVDQELTNDKIVDELLADKDLADSWGNYHLIGDVLRGETPNMISLDLADNVMSALDDDVTILAPATASDKATGVKGKVIEFVRPIGQVAIAASAAGLMILGVQQMNVANHNPATQNNVIQTTPLGGFAEPVSLSVGEQQKRQVVDQKQAYIEQQRRIHSLLVDHNQQVKLHSITSAEENNKDEKDDTPKQ